MILLVLASLLPLFRRAERPQDAAAELVARALTGDRRAFDDLYRAHIVGAHRLLTRLVGPTPDRDDLIQQAFLEAFRSLASFRGDAAFATWLHRIVVHTAYRHLRRQPVRAAELPEDLPSLAASPEHLAHQQQELGRALGYLSALKPKKRIAYVLRVVEGMSLDEIAVLVGANAPAVGQRVKHAQRELSAMVERDRRRQEPS